MHYKPAGVSFITSALCENYYLDTCWDFFFLEEQREQFLSIVRLNKSGHQTRDVKQRTVQHRHICKTKMEEEAPQSVLEVRSAEQPNCHFLPHHHL